jgi:predicted DCC family thiol-disulfide oxidoreductase YuxK
VDPILTVLYDEDCGFCRWSAGRLRAWDRHGALRFAPIQASDDLLAAVPVTDRLAAMHVVDAGGRVWTGGAALTRLAQTLPGAAPLGAFGRRFPGLTERGYRFVAARRTRLGRLLGTEACRVDPSRPHSGPP